MDSDTLNAGHPIVTTDFDNAVIQVLDYFMQHGLTSIGMIAGEEKTTDGKEQLIDQRFRTFRNYASELGVTMQNIRILVIFQHKLGMI